MHLFYQRKGVVSVFLVIILVPIIAVTSLFVDASRLWLAKSVASSSGDLALNSLMTQYDIDLNNLYGLMGSAQSLDDFKKKVETYFEDSMQSKGVASSYIQQTMQKVHLMLNNYEDISDFLQIDVEDFSSGGIENSGLNNPAEVKTQIVNFMKYRAPLDGISALLEKFQKVSDETEGKSDEAELLGKKEEAAEAEGTLMESLKTLYDLCKTYSKQAKSLYSDHKTESQGFEHVIDYASVTTQQKYKEIHEFVVCNLLYTSELNQGVKNFAPWSANSYASKHYFRTNKKASLEDIQEAMEELQKSMVRLKLREDEVKPIEEALDDSSSGKSELLRYITYGKSIKVPYQNFIEEANCFSKWHTILKQAIQFTDEEIDESKINMQISCDNGEVKRLHGSYRSICDALLQEGNQIWNNTILANSARPYKKMLSHSEHYTVSQSKINQMINQKKEEINTTVLDVHDELSSFVQTLTEISETIGQQLDKLEIVKEQLKDFNKKKDAWIAKAQQMAGNEMADTDLQLVSETENGGEGELLRKLEENVTDASVSDMANRLSVIQNHVSRLKSALRNLKYGSKSVKDISHVDKIIGELKASNLISQSDVENGTVDSLKQKANNTFPQLYKSFSETDKQWLNGTSGNPQLEVPKNQPDTKLYRFLKAQFRDSDQSEYDTKKEQQKKNKDKKNKLVDGDSDDEGEDTGLDAVFQNQDFEITEKGGSATLPSKTSLGVLGSISGKDNSKKEKKNVNLSGAADSLTSIFGTAGNAIKSAGTALRDDIYTIDYIQNMFTCETTVKEALYDIAEEKNKNVATYQSAKRAEAEVVSVFNNTDITNTYNHTMTNQLISNKNNICMGHEMEYILYGGSNSKNSSKAWGTIFAIRFAFNAIYGFTKLYPATATSDAEVIHSVATGISAATCGVVPIPLAKIAIILALVTAESLSDVSCMKIGMPVALVKTEDTWHISYKNVFAGETKDMRKVNKKSTLAIAFRYSDYLEFFLLASMLSGHEYAVYSRIADVIQVNMQHCEKNFSMEKAKTWFCVSATIKVKPLLLDLPLNKNYANSSGVKLDISSWSKFRYQMSNGYY